MFGRRSAGNIPDEGSKDWEIGQRAKDGSFFMGQRAVINPDGRVGKVYNIFTRAKDMSGFSSSFYYATAIQKTAKLNKKTGYGPVADSTDQEIRQALGDGSYNGRWTIPSVEILSTLQKYAKDGLVTDNFKNARTDLAPVEIAAAQGRNGMGGITMPADYWSSTNYGEGQYRATQNFSKSRNGGYSSSEKINENTLSLRLVRYVEAEPQPLSYDDLHLNHEDRENLQNAQIKAFHAGNPTAIQDKVCALDKIDERHRLITQLIRKGDDPATVIQLATGKLTAKEKKEVLDDCLSRAIQYNDIPSDINDRAFIASLLKGGANPNAFDGSIMAAPAINQHSESITPSEAKEMAQLLYKNGGNFDLGFKYLSGNCYKNSIKKVMASLCTKCTGKAPAAYVPSKDRPPRHH